MSFKCSNMFSSSSITMFLPVFSEILFLTLFLASKKAGNIFLNMRFENIACIISNNRDWICSRNLASLLIRGSELMSTRDLIFVLFGVFFEPCAIHSFLHQLIPSHQHHFHKFLHPTYHCYFFGLHHHLNYPCTPKVLNLPQNFSWYL